MMFMKPIVNLTLFGGISPQILSTFSNNSMATIPESMGILDQSLPNNTTLIPYTWYDPTFTIYEVIIMLLSSSLASMFTVLGNLLVIIAFYINNSLRTINNYLIINLAIADLMIGLLSMNFYTIMIIQGGWYMGYNLCQFWLILDYVCSQTSSFNLLVICIDRYLSVQYAVWYRNKRSVMHAVAAMVTVWVLSLLIWAVPILLYPYIRHLISPGLVAANITVATTVPPPIEDLGPPTCVVPFLSSSKMLTVLTALLAFYIPAAIMSLLYFKVYTGIFSRRKNLARMDNENKGEKQEVNQTMGQKMAIRYKSFKTKSFQNNFKKKIDNISVSMPKVSRNSIISFRDGNKKKSIESKAENSNSTDNRDLLPNKNTSHLATDSSQLYTTDTSDKAYNISVTLVKNSEDLCKSNEDHNSEEIKKLLPSHDVQKIQSDEIHVFSKDDNSNNKDDTVVNYRSNIKFKHDVDSTEVRTKDNNPTNLRSPRVSDLSPKSINPALFRPSVSFKRNTEILSLNKMSKENPCKPNKSVSDLKEALDVKTNNQGKNSSNSYDILSTMQQRQEKERKKKLSKSLKKEKRAARLLAAILLAFIILWFPYNFLVIYCVDTTFSSRFLWDLSYWLCYLNSTLNPLCYALCNETFKRTFIDILNCRLDNRRYRCNKTFLKAVKKFKR